MDFESRTERLSGRAAPGEFRSPFEKDRDRLLYSHAFLRLSGVTQVSSTTKPGQHHYRLAHSIKVAQVGAALARTLLQEYRTTVPRVSDLVDPYAVEAAGLSHDIGHPPTGHNGEATISRWARARLGEPFEGNAQTFRILTHLGDRAFDRPGYDLTRATLLASAKYPWSSEDPKAESGKFGYYQEDADVFAWAARGTQAERGIPTLEAQLMDWADDITYAIHDSQDYYRSGGLPLEALLHRDSQEARGYVDYLWETLQQDTKLRSQYSAISYLNAVAKLDGQEASYDAFSDVTLERLAKLGDVFVGLSSTGRYDGTHLQRCILVGGAAHLLGRLIEGPTEHLEAVPFALRRQDDAWILVPDDLMRLDVLLLKGLLFWKVVPELADEQNAEAQRLTALLDTLLGVLRGEHHRLLYGELKQLRDRFGELTERQQARYVTDYVAGLTDEEFKALHRLYCANEADQDTSRIARGAALPPWPFPLPRP